MGFRLVTRYFACFVNGKKSISHNPSFLLWTLLSVLFFQPTYLAYSQDIKLGRVNDLNYPEMELTFVATYPNGEKNYSLQVKDFEISENTRKTNVIEVINPTGDGVPVSVVLVFDVSASMKNERIALAKEAAVEFIKHFPLETSEVAIASFSNRVYLNCDFTQDPERLKNSISELYPDAGTDYSRAFLFSETGAIDIARKGKYKKAIVFLTDGQSSANAEEIIKLAQQGGISVYCITLALAMPDILKKIAQETGGKYYEAITNIYQLHNFYASINQVLQTSGYSILRWRALDGCEPHRSVKLYCQNIPLEFFYDIQKHQMGYLEPDPGILFFGNDTSGTPAPMNFSLKARNHAIKVTGITLLKKNYFVLNDTLNFPFWIEKDDTKKLNITYLNKEAGLISDKLTVSTEGCPPLRIDLNGGMEEELKLIAPAGGEIFPVGMDTAIIWEGIKRNKDVSLWYRKKPTLPWKFIADANGLRYNWKVPNDTGFHIQVKAEPILNDSRDFRVFKRYLSNEVLSDVFINADGSRILTVDKTGTVRLLEANTGAAIVTLGGFGIRHALLSDDNSKITGFAGLEMFVWDVASLKLVARFAYRQKLYVADTDPQGEETMLSARKYEESNLKYWSPSSNVQIPVIKYDTVQNIGGTKKTIALSSDNLLSIKHTGIVDHVPEVYEKEIKISPEVFSIVVHPNAKVFVVAGRNKFNVYSADKGGELYTINPGVYKKFSGNGEILVTADGLNTINFRDALSGENLFSLVHPVFYRMAYRSNHVLYYRGDTLSVKDLRDNKQGFKINDNQLMDALLSPSGNTLSLVRKNNTIDFYDVYDQKKINTLNEFDSPIIRVKYSADGKNLLVIMANSEILLFKPYYNKKLKEAISGEFSIVRPMPEVLDTVWFNREDVFSRKELVVDGFVQNNSGFPVIISGMKIMNERNGVFGLVSDVAPTTLEDGKQSAIELSFTPDQTNAHQAFLYTYTPTDTFKTVLIGEGVAKNYDLFTENIDFGKEKVNSTKDSLVIVLKNSGTEPITIVNVEMSEVNKGVFGMRNDWAVQTLNSGDFLTLSLYFSPKNRGRISGALLVKIKDQTNNVAISLFGEGLATREVLLMGKTINSFTNLPVSATVSCIDLVSGRVIQKQETDTSGIYAVKLNTDRDYGITAAKENFISGSENVNLTGTIFADTIYRDIYLTEIKSGAFIRLNCVFFDFAKWGLLPASKSELDRLAETLRTYPKMNIEIHGHTDSIGSNEANLTLSKNRAIAVRSFLIKKGINANRLFVNYFGESVPVTSNSTTDGRARNRRVEVKVR